MTSLFDNSMDISPLRDGQVLKRVLRRGDPSKVRLCIAPYYERVTITPLLITKITRLCCSHDC